MIPATLAPLVSGKSPVSPGMIFKRIKDVVFYLFMLSLGFFMIVPFLWMVSTAFKPSDEILSIVPKLIPNRPTLEAFSYVLFDVPVGRWYLNSIIVATIETASVVFFSSLTGYAFAKYEFRGKTLIFMAILATMMVPGEVTMIPLYLLVSSFGWIDTYQGLIVPGLISAFGIFLIRQFCSTVPNELIDAARVDGCPELRIYWNIALPLIKPALATLTIFNFMWSWNGFLWPLLITNAAEMRTLPLGVAMYFSEEGAPIYFNRVMAMALLTTAPLLAVFLTMQRHFIKGIALTGLKG